MGREDAISDHRLTSIDDRQAYDALALAAGKALDCWSQIEMAIADLFQKLSKMPDPKAAQAVMAAVVSFEARLTVCQALLQTGRYPEEILAKWKKLRKKLREASTERNGVAHFSIARLTPTGGAPYWALIPFFSIGQLAQSESTHGTMDTHSAASITDMTKKFLELKNDVRRLIGELTPPK